MKKVLGILALALSVSNFTLADQDQDTLKEIHFSTELRQGYTDKKENTGNGLGIAGFKGDNKDRTRWRNIFGGDLNLVDDMYLTIIDQVFNCDTFFPEFKNFQKQEIELHPETRHNEIPFVIYHYTKV